MKFQWVHASSLHTKLVTFLNPKAYSSLLTLKLWYICAKQEHAHGGALNVGILSQHRQATGCLAWFQQYEKGHCHTQSCHFVDLGQEQRFFLENIRILPVFINLFMGTLCQDTASYHIDNNYLFFEAFISFVKSYKNSCYHLTNFAGSGGASLRGARYLPTYRCK